MSSIHLAIAAVPVAVYLLLIGGLRLRKRPLLTTGWRDMLALGIASSGLMAIGPMQLFFPTQAAARWQGWVWIALLLLYVLGLVLVLISCKPRLIAYGLDEVVFRKLLHDAALSVDPQSNWNGDVLSLPSCGLQLVNEPSGTSRVHQVVLVGLLDNLQGWLAMERAFVKAGASTSCAPSAAGGALVLSGLLLLAIALLPMLSDPNEALAQLRRFLQR
ncbi:MAG: hypothetical protein KDB22_23440 [Planctomycetales bacterium]|nr:hypothetical protein [Planctomycetales bacterium]